jgi:hypothetical protein
LLGSLFNLLCMVATAQAQPYPSGPPVTRAEQEAFLSKAAIVSEATLVPAALRASLADGHWTHYAAVAWSSGHPAQGDYRSNVAAFELDKMLGLDLVSPSVERPVNGRPAALTWWVDDVLMDEVSRRRRAVTPPDPERWARQMQSVRMFDELTANDYRSMDPAAYTSTLWDNLLITRDWSVALIDHTFTFGALERLKYSDSLTRCDRRVLANLRALDREAFERRLGRFLKATQLDALEARRGLIVRHFDETIAVKGERAVLYDPPPRE